MGVKKLTFYFSFHYLWTLVYLKVIFICTNFDTLEGLVSTQAYSPLSIDLYEIKQYLTFNSHSEHTFTVKIQFPEVCVFFPTFYYLYLCVSVISVFVCLSLSSVAPVWTPRQVTWSWTVGNKISPPPSSASPPLLPTHRMRASHHHPSRFLASCATPGRLPIPMKPSKYPLYNLRPCLPSPPNNHLVVLRVTFPMNSELILNLWFWTWGTAGRKFGEK